MSAIARLEQKLVNVLAYAYKTLCLYFLIFSVLRFVIRNGGWINDFLVFLILSSAYGLVPLFRRVRRSNWFRRERK